jgi:hypothetical protein
MSLDFSVGARIKRGGEKKARAGTDLVELALQDPAPERVRINFPHLHSLLRLPSYNKLRRLT